jgi:hypothetical protein
MLEKIHSSGLRVLVVWEPILPTDWAPPTTAALGRIHEGGVIQFWDKNHLVSNEIRRELDADPKGPKPSCCTAGDNLWDLAVLYPKQVHWNGAAPKPLFAEGPVVRAQPALRRILGSLLKQAN